MKDFLQKILKSIAYASAAGGIVAGTAKIDLIDADASTTIYMVISAVLFNFVREYLKNLTGKK